MSSLSYRIAYASPERLTLVTAPATEPISTATAKTHLRVDVADDDTLIDGLIEAARRTCEDYTGRALITQTWQLFLDDWPGATIDDWWDGTRQGPSNWLTDVVKAVALPKPPLQSVTHIKTYDDNDVATTFSSGDYFVDTATEPGRIALRTSAAWPVPTRTANGIEIQFDAGYGNAGSNVPQDLLRGMLLLIGHLYENREQVVIGDTVNELPHGVRSLWQGKRIMRL